MQSVVDPHIGREAVSVYELPVADKRGTNVERLVFLVDGVRHAFSAQLHNLQITVVDPDASLEIMSVFFFLLRGDVEDVGIEIVDMLLAGVGEFVLRGLVCREEPGHKHTVSSMSLS